MLIAALFSVHGFASAQSMDEDEKLGCSILMCLANPEGPKAEPKCQQPINELAKRMAKFWKRPALPKCTSVEKDGSYYKIAPAGYPPCSDGYVTLLKGQWAYITSIEDAQKVLAAASKVQALKTMPTEEGKFFQSNGTDSDLQASNATEDAPAPKHCVKNKLGEFYLEESKGVPIFLFEKIEKIEMPGTAVQYEVYINNQKYSTGKL